MSDPAKLFDLAFPGASDALRAGQLSAAQAQALVIRYADATHPYADSILIYGSSQTQMFKSYSDIDVLIITNEYNHRRRHCTMFEGFALELNFYSEYQAHEAIRQSVSMGRRFPASGWATACILRDNNGIGAAVRSHAQRAVDAGPGKAGPSRIAVLRAFVTSLAIELATSENAERNVLSGLRLYEFLPTLILAAQGDWIERGDRSEGLISRYIPNWAARLASAYGSLTAGDASELVELAQEALLISGGPLWAGFVGTD